MNALPDREYHDLELVDMARAGNHEAFVRFASHHKNAMHALAVSLTRSEKEAEILVEETLDRIKTDFTAHKGPYIVFRFYVLAMLRKVAWEGGYSAGSVEPSIRGPYCVSNDQSILLQDPVCLAFESIPLRWQAVLWHHEVERISNAEIVKLLGINDLGISVLTNRARFGFIESYLQICAQHAPMTDCQSALEFLEVGGKKALASQEKIRLEVHLMGCSYCRNISVQISDVRELLSKSIAPLVVGGNRASYLTRLHGSNIQQPVVKSSSKLKPVVFVMVALMIAIIAIIFVITL